MYAIIEHLYLSKMMVNGQSICIHEKSPTHSRVGDKVFLDQFRKVSCSRKENKKESGQLNYIYKEIS